MQSTKQAPTPTPWSPQDAPRHDLPNKRQAVSAPRLGPVIALLAGLAFLACAVLTAGTLFAFLTTGGDFPAHSERYAYAVPVTLAVLGVGSVIAAIRLWWRNK